jgi:hypothetical protein
MGHGTWSELRRQRAGMPYPRDLTDEQCSLEPVFDVPGKRGRRYGDDPRSVVDAMLYIAQNWLSVAPTPGVVGSK